ncbi:hypothetical protein F4819DRAFT_90838 [Hypoxylon fuscum]|nr:hypothetical protein F4819DRAFT_90838 [Hypoxylon fuscum]
MSGFYNTLHMTGCREIPLPEVRLRQGTNFEWFGSSSPPSIIPVPDEISIMGAVFDQVRTLARGRPPLPQTTSEERKQIIDGRFDINSIFEEMTRYEAEIVSWLSEIRTLADPSLQIGDDIMGGSSASFDAFWRTLVYNREPWFIHESPNKKPGPWLGISFGYWYLSKKLMMKRLWCQDILQNEIFEFLLKPLADPFEHAENRVRDARCFFVSEKRTFGWVPHRTEIGDTIYVFQGMRIPVILRPQGAQWEIIGACYVHGLIDGEIWDLGGL